MTAPMERRRVAFIGLGAMGSPMAGRIIDAGFPVAVTDLDLEKADAFTRSHRGRCAATPRDTVQDAAYIVTMLPDSDIVEDVLFGRDSVLDGLRPGAMVIEMSSGVPQKTQRFAATLGQSGGTLIDAPVSGGVSRARTGDLAIMVGGQPADVERAIPLLEPMSSSIHRTGPVGTGQASKALNNLVSAACMAITCEALEVGGAFGLDRELMVDVLNSSSGMNNSTQRKIKQFVLSESFDSGFGLDLLVKDLGIALGLARQLGRESRVAELTNDLWARAQHDLGPGRDHTEFALAIAECCMPGSDEVSDC